MHGDLTEEIGKIKPLADAVVDAASALNAAIQAASANGLTVRIDILEQPARDDGERVPLVRARVSKRIA
jgi:uncharacterized protein YybS (DUF2232 family)